jgi:hypothetical protein
VELTNTKLIDKLKFVASKRTVFDRSPGQEEYDFSDIDRVDDAFDAGCRVGEIDFARQLCSLLRIEYTIEPDD